MIPLLAVLAVFLVAYVGLAVGGYGLIAHGFQEEPDDA